MDGDDADLGTWYFHNHGPSTITTPEGEQVIRCSEWRWAFSMQGTVSLELIVDDISLFRLTGAANRADNARAAATALRSLLAQNPTPPER